MINLISPFLTYWHLTMTIRYEQLFEISTHKIVSHLNWKTKVLLNLFSVVNCNRESYALQWSAEIREALNLQVNDMNKYLQHVIHKMKLYRLSEQVKILELSRWSCQMHFIVKGGSKVIWFNLWHCGWGKGWSTNWTGQNTTIAVKWVKGQQLHEDDRLSLVTLLIAGQEHGSKSCLTKASSENTKQIPTIVRKGF